MQLRSGIQLASIIKSMSDVVIPAIDPANTLALEQSRLILGLLALMRRQLPLQFDFDRDELQRLLDCAKAVADQRVTAPAAQAAQQTLAAASRSAAIALDACRMPPTALTDAVRGLRAALGGVVSALAADGADAAGHRIERLIIDMSRAQLLRDRALVKQQGWEPDPAAVPEIETLLDSRAR